MRWFRPAGETPILPGKLRLRLGRRGEWSGRGADHGTGGQVRSPPPGRALGGGDDVEIDLAAARALPRCPDAPRAKVAVSFRLQSALG